MNQLTNNNVLMSSAVICVLTVITGGLIYHMISRRRNYVKVAKVLKLFIYPVKSLAGIEVDELDVTKLGVKLGPFRDRSWMLVDGNNRFITLRTEQSLALLRTSFNEDQLWIDGPNLPTLKLNVITQRQTNDIVIETNVWKQSIEGIYCGEEAEQWFSKFLNKPGIKLIQHLPQLKTRSSDVQVNNKLIPSKKFPIAFQDECGLLVMNQNSIDELNEKLPTEQTISARNYRPNILVTDCNALEEDNWMYLKIRNIEFKFLKPCHRCILTTVNPETGIKDPEALNTLRTYRLAGEELKKLYGTSPLFGISVGPLNEGHINCGDQIFSIRSVSNY